VTAYDGWLRKYWVLKGCPASTDRPGLDGDTEPTGAWGQCQHTEKVPDEMRDRAVRMAFETRERTGGGAGG
jgi:hypothetical protein